MNSNENIVLNAAELIAQSDSMKALSEEYEAMLASVNSNKGFYIGRYETGYMDEMEKVSIRDFKTEPTEAEIDEETSKLVVQKDAPIYTKVAWGSLGAPRVPVNISSTYSPLGPQYVIGAVRLAQDFAKMNNYTQATTGLPYGIQWDMIMRFVEDEEHDINDSISWGNYCDATGSAATDSGILQTAGKNESWQAKNIYDLAGNAEEWTMESGYANVKMVRGRCLPYEWFLYASDWTLQPMLNQNC